MFPHWSASRLIWVLCGILISTALASAAQADSKNVTTMRTPDGGLQPQVAVDAKGVVHLVYYKGDPATGDLFYVRREPTAAEFSKPVRVNSQPSSAIAVGNIRGAQLAIGKAGRVHVVWNGSSQAQPRGPLNPEQPKDSKSNGTPMLYTRLADDGQTFEPQRNLMQITYALDGGGSVAADEAGHVLVTWHGSSPDSSKGEAGRQVWIASSEDQGQTFTREKPANKARTGTCACCGMRTMIDSKGTVYTLYRAATANVNRDLYLLVSKNQGQSFQRLVQNWQLNACPMTSMSLLEGPTGVFAAWETQGQVYYAPINSNTAKLGKPVAAPGAGGKRRYPAVAANADGQTILVWTENMAWQRGGSLAWQVFDKAGRPLAAESGRTDGVPAWSLVAAYADADGKFVVVY